MKPARHMQNCIALTIFLVFAVASNGVARAAIVTYTFSGTVTQANVGGVPALTGIAPGDPISGSYTFDTDAATEASGSPGTLYHFLQNGTAFTFNLHVGPREIAFSAATVLSIRVVDDGTSGTTDDGYVVSLTGLGGQEILPGAVALDFGNLLIPFDTFSDELLPIGSLTVGGAIFKILPPSLNPLVEGTLDSSFTVVDSASTALDYGDAPDPYPTLYASDGARHLSSGSPPFFGTSVDTEVNGLPSEDALGDDATGAFDDEDGLGPGSPLVVGQAGVVSINVDPGVQGFAFLSAWIDFNADGDWDDSGEQIAGDYSVFLGSNLINFAVPAGAVPGETFARFRLSSSMQDAISPMGEATSGEVEDYKVTIEAAPADSPPIANDDNATIVPTDPLPVMIDVAANDDDADGNLDATTATLGIGPINGALVNNGDGTFSYTPNLGFAGGDIFTYEICDTTNRCDTATVHITVTAPPPPALGASVTGMTPDKITCHTPGQNVVISGANPFDCESAGIAVNPGDRVRFTIDGLAQ